MTEDKNLGTNSISPRTFLNGLQSEKIQKLYLEDDSSRLFFLSSHLYQKKEDMRM